MDRLLRFYDLAFRIATWGRGRDYAVTRLVTGYDPYRDRPPELTHGCRLPRVSQVGTTRVCSACGCPWIVAIRMRRWRALSAATRGLPWKTPLVGTTKSVPDKPRWHFDQQAYATANASDSEPA